MLVVVAHQSITHYNNEIMHWAAEVAREFYDQERVLCACIHLQQGISFIRNIQTEHKSTVQGSLSSPPPSVHAREPGDKANIVHTKV